MPKVTPKIPPGLEELMLNLAKNIIKENPQNIYEFAAEYFEKLLKERDGKVDESYKKLPTYKAYMKSKKNSSTADNIPESSKLSLRVSKINPTVVSFLQEKIVNSGIKLHSRPPVRDVNQKLKDNTKNLTRSVNVTAEKATTASLAVQPIMKSRVKSGIEKNLKIREVEQTKADEILDKKEDLDVKDNTEGSLEIINKDHENPETDNSTILTQKNLEATCETQKRPEIDNLVQESLEADIKIQECPESLATDLRITETTEIETQSFKIKSDATDLKVDPEPDKNTQQEYDENDFEPEEGIISGSQVKIDADSQSQLNLDIKCKENDNEICENLTTEAEKYINKPNALYSTLRIGSGDDLITQKIEIEEVKAVSSSEDDLNENLHKISKRSTESQNDISYHSPEHSEIFENVPENPKKSQDSPHLSDELKTASKRQNNENSENPELNAENSQNNSIDLKISEITTTIESTDIEPSNFNKETVQGDNSVSKSSDIQNDTLSISATKIQSTFRGYKVRKLLKPEAIEYSTVDANYINTNNEQMTENVHEITENLINKIDESVSDKAIEISDHADDDGNIVDISEEMAERINVDIGVKSEILCGMSENGNDENVERKIGNSIVVIDDGKLLMDENVGDVKEFCGTINELQCESKNHSKGNPHESEANLDENNKTDIDNLKNVIISKNIEDMTATEIVGMQHQNQTKTIENLEILATKIQSTFRGYKVRKHLKSAYINPDPDYMECSTVDIEHLDKQVDENGLISDPKEFSSEKAIVGFEEQHYGFEPVVMNENKCQNIEMSGRETKTTENTETDIESSEDLNDSKSNNAMDLCNDEQITINAVEVDSENKLEHIAAIKNEKVNPLEDKDSFILNSQPIDSKEVESTADNKEKSEKNQQQTVIDENPESTSEDQTAEYEEGINVQVIEVEIHDNLESFKENIDRNIKATEIEFSKNASSDIEKIEYELASGSDIVADRNDISTDYIDTKENSNEMVQADKSSDGTADIGMPQTDKITDLFSGVSRIEKETPDTKSNAILTDDLGYNDAFKSTKNLTLQEDHQVNLTTIKEFIDSSADNSNFLEHSELNESIDSLNLKEASKAIKSKELKIEPVEFMLSENQSIDSRATTAEIQDGEFLLKPNDSNVKVLDLNESQQSISSKPMEQQLQEKSEENIIDQQKHPECLENNQLVHTDQQFQIKKSDQPLQSDTVQINQFNTDESIELNADQSEIHDQIESITANLLLLENHDKNKIENSTDENLQSTTQTSAVVENNKQKLVQGNGNVDIELSQNNANEMEIGNDTKSKFSMQTEIDKKIEEKDWEIVETDGHNEIDKKIDSETVEINNSDGDAKIEQKYEKFQNQNSPKNESVNKEIECISNQSQHENDSNEIKHENLKKLADAGQEASLSENNFIKTSTLAADGQESDALDAEGQELDNLEDYINEPSILLVQAQQSNNLIVPLDTSVDDALESYNMEVNSSSQGEYTPIVSNQEADTLTADGRALCNSVEMNQESSILELNSQELNNFEPNIQKLSVLKSNDQIPSNSEDNNLVQVQSKSEVKIKEPKVAEHFESSHSISNEAIQLSKNDEKQENISNENSKIRQRSSETENPQSFEANSQQLNAEKDSVHEKLSDFKRKLRVFKDHDENSHKNEINKIDVPSTDDGIDEVDNDTNNLDLSNSGHESVSIESSDIKTQNENENLKIDETSETQHLEAQNREEKVSSDYIEPMDSKEKSNHSENLFNSNEIEKNDIPQSDTEKIIVTDDSKPVTQFSIESPTKAANLLDFINDIKDNPYKMLNTIGSYDSNNSDFKNDSSSFESKNASFSSTDSKTSSTDSETKNDSSYIDYKILPSPPLESPNDVETPATIDRNTKIFDEYLNIYDDDLECFEAFSNNPEGSMKKSPKILKNLNEIAVNDADLAVGAEKLEVILTGTTDNLETISATNNENLKIDMVRHSENSEINLTKNTENIEEQKLEKLKKDEIKSDEFMISQASQQSIKSEQNDVESPEMDDSIVEATEEKDSGNVRVLAKSADLNLLDDSEINVRKIIEDLEHKPLTEVKQDLRDPENLADLEVKVEKFMESLEKSQKETKNPEILKQISESQIKTVSETVEEFFDSLEPQHDESLKTDQNHQESEQSIQELGGSTQKYGLSLKESDINEYDSANNLQAKDEEHVEKSETIDENLPNMNLNLSETDSNLRVFHQNSLEALENQVANETISHPIKVDSTHEKLSDFKRKLKIYKEADEKFPYEDSTKVDDSQTDEGDKESKKSEIFETRQENESIVLKSDDHLQDSDTKSIKSDENLQDFDNVPRKTYKNSKKIETNRKESVENFDSTLLDDSQEMCSNQLEIDQNPYNSDINEQQTDENPKQNGTNLQNMDNDSEKSKHLYPSIIEIHEQKSVEEETCIEKIISYCGPNLDQNVNELFVIQEENLESLLTQSDREEGEKLDGNNANLVKEFDGMNNLDDKIDGEQEARHTVEKLNETSKDDKDLELKPRDEKSKAAVIIQSNFRGYKVRKSNDFKKLTTEQDENSHLKMNESTEVINQKEPIDINRPQSIINESSETTVNERREVKEMENVESKKEENSKIDGENYDTAEQQIICDDKALDIQDTEKDIASTIETNLISGNIMKPSVSINTYSYEHDDPTILSPTITDENLVRRQSFIDDMIHSIEGSNAIDSGLVGYGEFKSENVEKVEQLISSKPIQMVKPMKFDNDESLPEILDGQNNENQNETQETVGTSVQGKSPTKLFRNRPKSSTTSSLQTSKIPKLSSSQQNIKKSDENEHQSTSQSQKMPESTVRNHHPGKYAKMSMLRQMTMPVQIESNVMRILPKHLRKRIKSADGDRKRKPVMMP